MVTKLQLGNAALLEMLINSSAPRGFVKLVRIFDTLKVLDFPKVVLLPILWVSRFDVA